MRWNARSFALVLVLVLVLMLVRFRGLTVRKLKMGWDRAQKANCAWVRSL